MSTHDQHQEEPMPYSLDGPTPTEVRTVTCPFCKAEPGEQCQGVRGLRKANHMERVREFGGK